MSAFENTTSVKHVDYKIYHDLKINELFLLTVKEEDKHKASKYKQFIKNILQINLNSLFIEQENPVNVGIFSNFFTRRTDAAVNNYFFADVLSNLNLNAQMCMRFLL